MLFCQFPGTDQFQEQYCHIVFYSQTFSDVAGSSGFEFAGGDFLLGFFFFKDFTDTTILHTFSCINGLATEVNMKTWFQKLLDNTHCSI